MLAEISNTPRDYAWGSRTAIAELLGRAPSGGPEAELWLGAHPGSPARLVSSGESLVDVVGGRLPFLMKVLAAAEPLSLQAHPTPEQAEAGFAREEAAGVPIDAPDRNYKDRYHKPELMYALSDPFLALCGFRPVAETLAELAPVADDPHVASFINRLADGDAALKSVVEWLVRSGSDVVRLAVALVELAGEGATARAGASWDTVRRLGGFYPGDPGIAVSMLMHTVALAPGQALYLPAGNIHAYLEGFGIEVMAASDNVLRGGLTPKHIDVPELLSVLDFRPLPVPLLSPVELEPGVAEFRPDVPDFTLTVVSADAAARGVTLALGGRPAIALVVGGGACVGGLEVAAGSAVYASGEAELRVQGSARVFVASTALE